ncbi:MAG TPA: hypothetical protein VN175_11390 [Rhizomicrobium sp.]|jgi:hypothetical protein|nr:hypothetical protein [Rhizomicrobium sp.]
MPQLLPTADAPLVRTDFSDQSAWSQLLVVVRMPSEDGFLANITVVDDPAFQDADPRALAGGKNVLCHAVLFVADAMTFAHNDKPILCIAPPQPQHTFRVIPSQLWSVENNLSLANMDWEDFAGAVDADGIFRGFA